MVYLFEKPGGDGAGSSGDEAARDESGPDSALVLLVGLVRHVFSVVRTRGGQSAGLVTTVGYSVSVILSCDERRGRPCCPGSSVLRVHVSARR